MTCQRPKCGKEIPDLEGGYIMDDGSTWCQDCWDEYLLYLNAPECHHVHCRMDSIR